MGTARGARARSMGAVGCAAVVAIMSAACGSTLVTPSSSESHVAASPVLSLVASPSGSASTPVASGSPDGSSGPRPPRSVFESQAIQTVGSRRIPSRYTCDGNDVSPPFNWTVDLPDGGPVAEYAITVTDSDANDFVHWVVAGIAGSEMTLPEGAGDAVSATGLLEGRNAYGTLGYQGPCPPTGQRHRYEFSLYAFSATVVLSAHPTIAEIRKAARTGAGATVDTFSAFYSR